MVGVWRSTIGDMKHDSLLKRTANLENSLFSRKDGPFAKWLSLRKRLSSNERRRDFFERVTNFLRTRVAHSSTAAAPPKLSSLLSLSSLFSSVLEGILEWRKNSQFGGGGGNTDEPFT